MFTVRRHLRAAVLVALLAMLALAVGPTWLRALAASSGAGNWAEICTTYGAKRVPQTDEAKAGVSTGAQAMAHCPLCVLSSMPLALAPPDALRLPAPSAVRLAPVLVERQTVFQQAWPHASPRGPPVES